MKSPRSYFELRDRVRADARRVAAAARRLDAIALGNAAVNR